MAEVLLPLSFDIDEANLSYRLLNEIKKEMNRAISLIYSPVKNQILSLVSGAIKDSREYKQMLPGGVLYGQVGRPDIEEILGNIIKAILNEIEVTIFPFNIVGEQVVGALEIKILELSFNQVLAVNNTWFESENDFPVYWLNWLLFQGDRTIISNYRYLEDFSGLRGKNIVSRTNTGIMKRSNRGWGFPAEFAGTAENNWLTRAVDKIDDNIINIVERELGAAGAN